MVDKIVNAINEILGGEDTTPEDDQPKKQPASGFIPADQDSGRDQQAGQKGQNLDQLLSDAKKQIGEKPQ